MNSDIWRWINLLEHFTISELTVFFLGKVSLRFKREKYFSIIEKKNKIDFLFLNGIKKLTCSNGLFFLKLNLFQVNLKLSIRVRGSDVYVLKQILIEEEFKFILELFEQTFNHKPNSIVDAGANIGCSSLYFFAYNQECKILAIEPSSSNIELASHNITQNNCSGNVIFVQKALWVKKERLAISNNFRDGLDWSITMVQSDDGEMESITPDETYEYLGSSVIDFFKIDIEGTEMVLFGLESDQNWLRNVKMITIEIHPEFGSEEIILSSLKERGFRISQRGELTIGLNSIYLNAIH